MSTCCKNAEPGSIIELDKNNCCKQCGRSIYHTTNNREEWEKQFDEVFLREMGKDDGYSAERATLKDFIRTKINQAVSDRDRELLGEINRLLHIDGEAVRAVDVLDTTPRETLHNALAFIVARLGQVAPTQAK